MILAKAKNNGLGTLKNFKLCIIVDVATDDAFPPQMTLHV
jgi:hypothetical protein